MTATTVVLGFSDALSAPEVVWSLVDAGHHVAAFAKQGRTGALAASRHVTLLPVCSPHRSWAACVRDMEEHLERLAAETDGRPIVLLPIDDVGAFVFAHLRLPAGVRLAGPDLKLLPVAVDKRFQNEIAEQAGFNVICTWSPLAGSAATDALPDAGGIIKARFALRRDGDRVTKDQPHPIRRGQPIPDAILQRAEDYLVQPFLTEATGYGLFGLATATGVHQWSAHQRVRMMNPDGSGSSACRSYAPEPALLRAAERFIELTGWRGLFMIELIRDQAGEFWFMEFNGRSWGSMALARRQRLEYPAWVVASVVEPSPPPPPAAASEPKIVTCRHLGREIAHLLFVARATARRPRQAGRLFSTSLRMLTPTPRCYWYNWRSDDPKVFVRDTIDTVARLFRKDR
jgi:hypothetical protein